jgi:hypothetical protein
MELQMKGKILFVAGLGLGYLLGTRAGREKYDELKSAALKVWNDPRVQKQVEVAEFVSDGAKSIVDKVSGKSAPATKPAARRTTASKPASTSSGSSSSGS